jgi:hypothetical protein
MQRPPSLHPTAPLSRHSNVIFEANSRCLTDKLIILAGFMPLAIALLRPGEAPAEGLRSNSSNFLFPSLIPAFMGMFAFARNGQLTGSRFTE